MPTKTGEIKSDISIKWYGRKSICVVLGRINLDIIRNKCGNFKTSVARGKKQNSLSNIIIFYKCQIPYPPPP